MSTVASNNKGWIYALAGGVALVSAAVLFHLLTSKVEEKSVSQLYDEIDNLGEVKRDPSGVLSYPYFKDLFIIVYKQGKAIFAVEKKKMMQKRR